MENNEVIKTKPKKPIVEPGRTHNEDWNRMSWAIFKLLMLLFILLTVRLYIANLFHYKHT
jgi:hypothetical protein